MKRLLCIISNMNAGGAETFIMKLYRKLNRSKYQIDFCINFPEKCFYEDEITQLGGYIFRISSKSDNLNIFKRDLSEIIEKHQYKIVLRITSNAMGFYDLKIAEHSGAKRCIARSSNSSDGAGLKVKLAHVVGKLLFRKYVDVKIAPSDVAAQYTFGKRAYGNGGVYILRNALDIDLYKFDMDERNKIRRALGISDSTLVVGHVGRFNEQKNHAFLVQIFNKLQQFRPDSRLILVGNGNLIEKIKGLVQSYCITDKVIFTGVRKDINKMMSVFDVFVFPSFYEGMPNVIIEAQASGLPCVLSDTITKEADITGLLKYESLNVSPEIWAKDAIEAAEKERIDTKQKLIQAGYDIESCTRKFESIVFE